MQLDLSEVIKKLQKLEKTFNKTDVPSERFVILETLNHIAAKELPIKGYWYDLHRTAALGEMGADVRRINE